MEFFVFLVYVGLCIGVGVFADSRGRNGVGWGFFSLLLSPLLGFIIVLVIEKRPTLATGESSASTGTRKCPFCAELIRAEAVKCKHCSSDLEPLPRTEVVKTTTTKATSKPLAPDDMACFNCYKHIPKTALSCAYCGVRYTPVT